MLDTRSKTLRNMYPADKMMEAFGTLHPKPLRRAIYFNQQWHKWEASIVRTSPSLVKAGSVCPNKTILRGMGLCNYWDYQSRRVGVPLHENRERTMPHTVYRFADPENAIMFAVACENKLETV